MITKAIFNLRPTASFIVIDEDYKKIVWNSPSIDMPTEEEVLNEVNRINDEYVSKEYQRLRIKEYPDHKDFLDAWVKNDQEALEEYRQKCLNVKLKYPKPE
jgi:hypothetical protein